MNIETTSFFSRTCIKIGYSRLAKAEKVEFTLVNEHFLGKLNAVNTIKDGFFLYYKHFLMAIFVKKHMSRVC